MAGAGAPNAADKRPHLIVDWEVSAGVPLRHHQIALCLLLALDSSDPDTLALLPGLTPGQLSMLRSNRIVSERTQEFREKYLGAEANEQFQRYMPKVFETFSECLNDPNMKLERRLDAAKWIAEKVTGKARQELEVSGGATLLQFLRTLDEIKQEREVGPAALALPASQTEHKADPIDAWVQANILKETK